MDPGEWAESLSWRAPGGLRMPAVLGVRTARAAARDRVTGLAAEMAFFGLLSIVPALVALGAAFGFLAQAVGAESVAAARAAIINVLGRIFTTDVLGDQVQPLVDELLTSPRGGVATSSLLLALFLAGRVFAAVIRALDQAYGVEEERGLIGTRLLGVAFALGAVVVVAVGVVVLVVGPLLGGGVWIAQRIGAEALAVEAWRFGRIPTFVAVAIAGFATLYRIGPNHEVTWRASLPGAVVGVALWAAFTGALRAYLELGGRPTGRAPGLEGDAVLEALGLIGAVVAVVVWVYLSSLALLLGGELNAEVERLVGGSGPDREGQRPSVDGTATSSGAAATSGRGARRRPWPRRRTRRDRPPS